MGDANTWAQLVDAIARRQPITEPVRAALLALPRHHFVSAASQGQASDDKALPTERGQTISQPTMVAVMLEGLALSPSHRVLEIGSGSGWVLALLSRLAVEVHGVERVPGLAQASRERLGNLRAAGALGPAPVTVHEGDGCFGLPAAAPFDRILVSAAAAQLPPALREQLADGGRLLAPVGPAREQRLLAVDRLGDRFEERAGPACVFVPLVGS